jgi:hypothetical protein
MKRERRSQVLHRSFRARAREGSKGKGKGRTGGHGFQARMCWATKSLLALAALMVTGVESFAVQKCMLEGRGLRRRPAVQGKTRVSTVAVSASASVQPLW